jgi:hypothetical protein
MLDASITMVILDSRVTANSYSSWYEVFALLGRFIGNFGSVAANQDTVLQC